MINLLDYFDKDKKNYSGGGFRNYNKAAEIAVISNGKGLILPSILSFKAGRKIKESRGSLCVDYPPWFKNLKDLRKIEPRGLKIIWRVYN